MKKSVLLVILAVVLALMFLCVWRVSRLDWEYIVDTLDGGQHTMPQESVDYIFDPRVIATVVPEGNFLTPVPPGTPIPTSEPIPGLVVWDESVFSEIAARAFEDRNEMQLIGVSFGSPCSAAGSGLSRMGFEYIRRRSHDEMEKKDLGGFPYLYVSVRVNLDGVRYYASVSTYFKNAAAVETRRPALDYEGLEIKAALEAIRIAEDHGGRDFRSQAGDVCKIYGVLGGRTPGWVVWYQENEEETAALEFRINAESGEVIAVEQ